jgi:hypothetical protein
MKVAVVKISEVMKHPTMRLDAKHWVHKTPMRTQKEILAQLKQLRKKKSDYVKELRSLDYATPLTNKIHKDLINIYDLQITTLNWVLNKRKTI